MTTDQCRRFLVEMARSGNLAFACHAAEVTRSEAVEDRDDDPAFERAWRAAQRRARAGVERACT